MTKLIVVGFACPLDATAPAATDQFLNGVLVNSAGTTTKSASTGTAVYVGGLPLTSLGQLVTVDATAAPPANSTVVNGFLISPAGALCTSTGPVQSWNGGMPFDANGALVVS